MFKQIIVAATFATVAVFAMTGNSEAMSFGSQIEPAVQFKAVNANVIQVGKYNDDDDDDDGEDAIYLASCRWMKRKAIKLDSALWWQRYDACVYNHEN